MAVIALVAHLNLAYSTIVPTSPVLTLEQYLKIPMSSYTRPDDASLHFTPTYFHRKFGAARSITTATVCLIHPAYWTPSHLHIHPRAPVRYQPEHQLVSELMKFGKQELGSVVVKESSSDVSEND
ncbi:hypothetical protein K488DRAFT_92555 [Vararia minispora EC-137]|uniref:Uncharacterized protein n=1 Tax=Vararia minispora EC-137 TaxID=1314806 RepID=A0ACB8Q449_9AGAM|nr:hypothetical protein K488DRAFT_92555 [Vararia minispora EC-137]